MFEFTLVHYIEVQCVSLQNGKGSFNSITLQLFVGVLYESVAILYADDKMLMLLFTFVVTSVQSYLQPVFFKLIHSRLMRGINYRYNVRSRNNQYAYSYIDCKQAKNQWENTYSPLSLSLRIAKACLYCSQKFHWFFVFLDELTRNMIKKKTQNISSNSYSHTRLLDSLTIPR